MSSKRSAILPDPSNCAGRCSRQAVRVSGSSIQLPAAMPESRALARRARPWLRVDRGSRRTSGMAVKYGSCRVDSAAAGHSRTADEGDPPGRRFGVGCANRPAGRVAIQPLRGLSGLLRSVHMRSVNRTCLKLRPAFTPIFLYSTVYSDPPFGLLVGVRVQLVVHLKLHRAGFGRHAADLGGLVARQETRRRDFQYRPLAIQVALAIERWLGVPLNQVADIGVGQPFELTDQAEAGVNDFFLRALNRSCVCAYLRNSRLAQSWSAGKHEPPGD